MDRHIYKAEDERKDHTDRKIAQPYRSTAIYQDWTPGTIATAQKRKEEESMDVDLIFKIAAIGIIVAVINQVLIRSGREEQAMLTTLAGLIVVLSLIVVEISDLFRMVKSVFGL